MKAMIFETQGGPEVLQYKETPKPAVGHSEVLIQVKASACNYNDIWARRGLPGMEIIMPHISGSDVSGVVSEIGPGVRNVKVGDEVIVHCGISCRECEACTERPRILLQGFQNLGFSDRAAGRWPRRVLQGAGGQRAAQAGETKP